MNSSWLRILAIIPLLLGGTYNSCYGPPPVGSPPHLNQPLPGWFSTRIGFAWRRLGRSLFQEAKERSQQIHSQILAETKKIPSSDLGLPETNPAEINEEESYGRLPEVRVDETIGAIFPAPRSEPHRSSWFAICSGSRRVLRKISKLESDLNPSHESGAIQLGAVAIARAAARWSEISADLVTLAGEIRYLEFWEPELKEQWKTARAHGTLPTKTLLSQAISSNDPVIFESLREVLKPRRTLHRSFIPDSLEEAEAGIIEIPIATDISDPKFIAEVDGALDTYWNQSTWARSQEISFHIHWRRIPKDSEFAAKKITLDEHLRKFPLEMAAMTTGGLTTYVVRQTLVFGPGKINPRGIAHELGHLMGFPDCYLRTLNGQGIFGLAVLEWDNPIYPDDLMCDNVVGVPRAEVW